MVMINTGLTARAAVFTWDGGATGGNLSWVTATNWNPDGAPSPGGGHDLVFADRNGAGTIDQLSVSTNATYGTLTFDDAAGKLGTTLEILTNATNTGTARTLSLNNGIALVNTGKSVIFNDATNGVLDIVLTGNNTMAVSTGGTLTLEPVISGGFSLTKTGDGTLNLSGANTYTGATIIDGGTLMLGADDALPSASQVDFSGGKLATNGKDDLTAGSLLLSSSSVLDMSGGTGSELWFANSSGPAWSGTFSIWNWTPGTTILRFGTTASGLDSTQLSHITVYSGSGTGEVWPARLDSNGYLVAIPEPGSAGILLLILAGIGWRERHIFLHHRRPLPMPI